jgi:hypothetical protein
MLDASVLDDRLLAISGGIRHGCKLIPDNAPIGVWRDQPLAEVRALQAPAGLGKSR